MKNLTYIEATSRSDVLNYIVNNYVMYVNKSIY